MSHKKKASLLSECSKCGCFVLTKEESKHKECCTGSLDAEDETFFISPGSLLRGSFQHIADPCADLPENAVGWSKNAVVLVNPCSLRALDAQPRQPVWLETQSGRTTALLWPSNQVSPLRCWLREGEKERRVVIHVVKDALRPRRLHVEVKATQSINEEAIKPFIQTYLRGSYLVGDTPFPLSYCGRELTVTVRPSLQSALDQLTIDDEGPSVQILHVSSFCRLSVSLDSSSPSTLPSLSFDQIPGLVEAKRTLRDMLIVPMKTDIKPCSILVYGISGSGKSLLLSSLIPHLSSSASLVHSIDQLVDTATLMEPGGIVVADVNTLPKDTQHSFYRVLPEVISKGLIVVLGVCSVDDVPLCIRVRFPIEVECAIPSEDERASILRHLLPSLSHQDSERISRLTHAFTGSDLTSMVRIASCQYSLTPLQALESSRRLIRPTGLRQFALEVPSVSWSDIAGNEELKLEIEQAVIWPLSHRDSFIRFGVSAPCGILLYGPPGCSKTLIARALAHESKMNFISVKGPELFSKWVGDSEKAIRQLFARARQVSPSIVFFDEIDAVGSTRGSSSTGGGVNERVLAQLLTELDGLEGNDGVVLVAATNRPDHLDSALLRPGRLDRALYVPLPSPSTRTALLNIRASKMPFSPEVSIVDLVSRTDAYSGAELVAVCQTAALAAMRDEPPSQKILPKHFDFALSAVRPRTDKKMLKVYEKFKQGAFE